ncbi:TetR/AcrR family transcriptional regulator [Micromonospora sp. NBC_01796]|uniref:TetR/AcrR family transcriptional regulator n=1 Tax=Micromonospora sp. NBC_01796 TaxID=2975987 RepID=UPI002DDA1CA6|nr:helix-turn-helix domain-containing protein [Micromonospora sp. NBC_01796]WSA84359.1 TetR/AcrR family transcriptional regulator [Micromonospora sp. NBC_01796]
MDQNKTVTRTAGGRNRIRTGADSPSPGDAGQVRAHIQRIALGLFIEKGYDKTSLREIAEQLGVTKAALYYHFPTKEDIVSSLVEKRIAAVEELIAWARQQPDPELMRPEFVRRYAAGLHDVHRHEDVLLFFEQNKTLVNTLRAGTLLREQMIRVFELLAEPDEPLTQQLCRVMAIFSIHAGWQILRDRGTDEERRQATLEVALQIMQNADHHPA